MPSIKQSVIRIALPVALGAAALVSGPSAASASDFQPEYWNYKCDSGRACVYKDSGVWNIESCGVSGLNDYFRYARAHGNAFTIKYSNGQWDYVAPWSERSLDGRGRAISVQVFC